MVDAAIKTQLATGQVKMIWLVAIGFETTLRLTNADHDVYYGGAWYSAWPEIDVDAPKSNMGGGITVSLPDDGTIEDIEQADDAAGRTITVTRLYDTASGWKAVQEWSGIIENYDSDNYARCIFRADAPHLLRTGPSMPLWQDQCINDFKGTACGYAGATTSCDGSWDACAAMAGGSNTQRFISAIKAPVPGEVVVLGGQRYTVGGYSPPPEPDPPGEPPWRPTAAPHNQPTAPLQEE